MSDASTTPRHRAILVLPRLRIQNANAISSPMTWGFPAMTAFIGAMTALERRLGRDAGIALLGVGVVCHAFEAQVTTTGFTRSFHLTRNPLLHDGSSAAIVEEGRVHLDITLVFEALLADTQLDGAARERLARRAADVVAGMRVAGGSVMPSLPASAWRRQMPALDLVPDDAEEQRLQFRRLARRCLPGFALVSRDDLLQQRLLLLRRADPTADVLDAWLDLSRWTARAVRREAEGSETSATIEWLYERRAGWTVPIPVGFAALSPLLPAGSVTGARDARVPFRFVETVWSMGQWISPHRLRRLSDLVWQPDTSPDDVPTLYRCINGYEPSASTPPVPALSAGAPITQ